MKSHKVKYDRWQKEIQSTTTHFRWETFQSVNNPVVITSWLCAQKLELNSHIVVQPNMSSVKVLWLNLLLEGSKVSTPSILHFLFFFLFIETKMSFSVTGGNGLLQPREKICMGMSLRLLVPLFPLRFQIYGTVTITWSTSDFVCPKIILLTIILWVIKKGPTFIQNFRWWHRD